MARRPAVRHPAPPPEFYKAPDIGGSKPEVPHPEVTRRTSRRYEEREVLLPGVDDGPRAISYGEQRLAGKLQFVHYRAVQDELWCVIELCAGECDGLIEVKYSDGRPTPSPVSKWQYWWYPGTVAGQVNPNLAAVLPSWNEAFAGTCYVVARLASFGGYWKATIPDLIWRMRTRKCLLPDTGTYVYSTNVWNQWYDFARWSEGKGLSSTRIDAASFVAAREADAAAGRKAESHLLLLDETSPDDVIQTFRLMARAYWFWDATRYRVVADRPASSVATYDDRHVSKSSVLDLDRADIFDRPNKVTVWYTDVANNWQQKPMSLATTAVDAGTEDPIEEEYRLPHLHDPAQVKSLLTYLLNSRQYDVKIREKWMAATADRQLGDLVTRVVESRGLTIPMRLVRRVKNADNSFEVELFEHNDAKFAEYVLTDSPKIQSTFPDPSAPPPNVDAASILWTEELYQTPTGDWLPKGTLTFTPPASFPFLETIEVWLSINGGPQRHWFDTASSPALTPTLWETGSYALTLKTKHRITQEVSSGTTKSFAVTGVTGIVPEVVDLGAAISTRWWSMPQTRSITRYGASYWSHSGLTTFNAAAINDGLITTTAITTPSGSAWLQYDAGAGVTKPFRELAYYHSGTLVSTPWILYSDDGTTWYQVTESTGKQSFNAGGGITGRTLAWQSAGAHRLWRVHFSAVNSFTELHFSEYIGQFSQIKEFRVYDVRSGSRVHYLSIPVGALPSSAKPLTVEPIMTSITADWGTGGHASSEVEITVVNSAGSESTGVASKFAITSSPLGGEPAYLARQQTGITLANGANNAVELLSDSSFVRVTGPTSSFSLGGLSALSGGSTIFVCNATAYPMTVVHESSGAAAADRIVTPSAGSVVVQPGATLALTRDATSARWRLWWDQVEWTNVSGKPTAIARIQDQTGSYASINIAGSAGSYAGIRFPDSFQDQTLMLHTSSDLQGVFRQDVGAWSWCWQNGALVVGAVPWARLTNMPTTLGGYGITDAAPLASPAFAGTPTAPTPSAGDNTAKLATTAFVQAAVASGGGGLLSTTTVVPSNGTGLITETSGRPGAMPISSTITSSTTDITVLSITGKGRLRFLSTGHTFSNGAVMLTVIVDGTTVINAQSFQGSSGGATSTPLVVPVVGSIAGSSDGGGTYYTSPIPEGDGFEFKTSLTVKARVTSGFGFVGWSYRLYA